MEKTDFDVFISCRKTDSNNKTTRDYSLAHNVYDFLTTKGISPFLAEESLPVIGQPEFKQIIDDVLDSVGVMVVVGTSVENLESRWVRYEWDSFFNDILSGIKKGVLISYLDGIDLKALPRTLRQNQAIQHADGAFQILFDYISSALGLSKISEFAKRGNLAFDRLNQIIEIMAESRILELEITQEMFGMIFSPEQKEQMAKHIRKLRELTNTEHNQ